MIINKIKEEARKDWEEIVKFCRERKDGPSADIHENFLEETIDRTTLAVLGMVEGELPKDRISVSDADAFSRGWRAYRKETLSRLQALRTEIEGKTNGFAMCVDKENCRLRGEECRGSCQINRVREEEV